MTDISGLTAFASPNIDVRRSGDSKSEQQALLQSNITRLKASDSGYDHQLAPLLRSALELFRDREAVIQTLLDQGKDPRTKANALEQMGDIPVIKETAAELLSDESYQVLDKNTTLHFHRELTTRLNLPEY